MSRFTNRIAFLTGAASGVGRATTIRLASEGAAVFAVVVPGAAAAVIAGVSARLGGRPHGATNAIAAGLGTSAAALVGVGAGLLVAAGLGTGGVVGSAAVSGSGSWGPPVVPGARNWVVSRLVL